MTKQTMNKTKKIKIIVAIILSAFIIISGTVVSLSLIKTSHIMKFNNPDKIVVYYNSSTNNIVFEPTDSEYNTICNMINKSHEQSILSSIFNVEIFNDVDIEQHEAKLINFDGFKVSFVYNTPQIAKLESKIHSNNIWYQSLLFDISSKDGFNYNTTYIISPENTGVEKYSYTSHYVTYSSLSDLYNYLNNIFD